MNSQEITALTNICEKFLDLHSVLLADEYYYQSLPLCIIDAVYSPGARYPSTRNAVMRYCAHVGLQRIRSPKTGAFPKTEHQQSIPEFLDLVGKYSFQTLAHSIFRNNQRTHTRGNPPLKAEAVVRFSKVLQDYQVNTFQDLAGLMGKGCNNNLEQDLDVIPGQSKDVSIAYFFMLSGSDDFIKADRRVRCFVEKGIGRPVSPQETQTGLRQVTGLLALRYVSLTARLLDSRIWEYDQSRGGKKPYFSPDAPCQLQVRQICLAKMNCSFGNVCYGGTHPSSHVADLTVGC